MRDNSLHYRGYKINKKEFEILLVERDQVKGHIREFDLPLDNVLVSALNVTKLRSDNVDPREYLERVAQWESKVTDGGGE